MDSKLKTMEQEYDVKPDLVSYNIAIEGHAKKGNLQAAHKYYELVQKLNMRPDEFTNNSLLKAFVIAEEFDSLEQFIKEHHNQMWPSVLSFQVIFDSLYNTVS
jgi:pentatricopeptide repeat protein